MDLSIFLIQEAMAKDGFVIYKSFYAPIQSLSDESLGKLFRAIFEYQIHGVCVELPVELTMAFNFFKTKFESDNIKYEAIVERNKANGKKGGRPSKGDNVNETIENPMGFEEPKKADKEMDKDKEGNKGDKENTKKERIDKSIPKKKAKFNVRDDLSYVDKTFLNLWRDWLSYKDELGCQYKTQRGAMTQYKSLMKYSNKNIILATAIVNRSIENSWQGLFDIEEVQKQKILADTKIKIANGDDDIPDGTINEKGQVWSTQLKKWLI